ncbi:sugar transferase [Pseudophaeobacter profundi]|uniref:sugar transferase n=1 Tax=Pseudophaeobacter profundi TaxID=3034152 RepID=UPI00243272E1|nr:sugar transferase [Pseudophaeobacter profundi]
MQDIDAPTRTGARPLLIEADTAYVPWTYNNFGKRAADILIVLLSAPVVLLLILPFLMLISLDGGRPFFAQQRVGRGGKTYRMWKLRSMVMNADTHLAAYLEQDKGASEEWAKNQKLKNDPRITRIGRLIRKTSIDELPQLWNVLKGDMSLVGPRPMMVDQKALYPGEDYYALRPGITGLWQVSARNESTFAERATFDDQYFRDLSPKTDFSILVKTVSVVCRATGH